MWIDRAWKGNGRLTERNAEDGVSPFTWGDILVEVVGGVYGMDGRSDVMGEDVIDVWWVCVCVCEGVKVCVDVNVGGTAMI